MIICPICLRVLRRSTGGAGLSAGMPEGTVVLACMECRRFTVEGSGRWVGSGTPGGTDLIESLRILASVAKQKRDTTKAIMESDIDDPRWEAIS
jgi:hypothetical protein